MSSTSITMAAKAALISALVLLCAQTLALAHEHEPATEAVCAVCSVSGDHALPAGTPGTSSATTLQVAIPDWSTTPPKSATTRAYSTRAPPAT